MDMKTAMAQAQAKLNATAQAKPVTAPLELVTAQVKSVSKAQSLGILEPEMFAPLPPAALSVMDDLFEALAADLAPFATKPIAAPPPAEPSPKPAPARGSMEALRDGLTKWIALDAETKAMADAKPVAAPPAPPAKPKVVDMLWHDPEHLGVSEAAVVKGMLARGDKQQWIVAWFGGRINPGRIAEINTGARFPEVMEATDLPPRGPYTSARASRRSLVALSCAHEANEKIIAQLQAVQRALERAMEAEKS
jgi:hypothetical protein